MVLCPGQCLCVGNDLLSGLINTSWQAIFSLFLVEIHSRVSGRVWSWLGHQILSWCHITRDNSQSNYLRWCEWHETCLLNCSNIRKSVVVWELGPPLQLIWGATTCPHSAGNQMSLRYLVKNTSKNPRPHQKFTIKGFFVEKVFLALATSRISFLSLTNLETFLSFPLLGWYGRKVTDLSHHQPSAWLTNQICPSLTVLCLITPNNLPVTSNQKWQ